MKNKYIYNYSDHLGNTRLSYFHNGSSIEVLEESNYYPFGLKHDGYNALNGNPAYKYKYKYKYKYNGKELQEETGMYDYGARFYMPELGRWGVIDPMAEKYRRWSPYNYAVNNPIMFTDPDGRQVLSGDDAISFGESLIQQAKAYNAANAEKTDEISFFSEIGDDGESSLSSWMQNYLSGGLNDMSKPNDVIFLTDSKSVGGLGHAAVIIGNEKDGWFYYSLNGTGGDTGRAYGNAIGADIKTDLGKMSMEDAIKSANTINPNYTHDYDKNIALISSSSEDKAMMKAAANAAGVKKYVLTAQDCLTVPMAAFNELRRIRGGGGPQTAKVPIAWNFFLPMTIGVINLYLPSGSELKYKRK